MSVWDDVADLLDRYDGGMQVSCGSASAWGGQLRLTLTDPPQAPARSIAFYSAGGATPAHVARALLDDARTWLQESDVEPMPVPEWMR